MNCRKCRNSTLQCRCVNTCSIGLLGCNGPVWMNPAAICGSCTRQLKNSDHNGNLPRHMDINVHRIRNTSDIGIFPFMVHQGRNAPVIDVIGCKFCMKIGHSSKEHKCGKCGIVGDHSSSNCEVSIQTPQIESRIRRCYNCGCRRETQPSHFCSNCGVKF